jgi:predicted RNase H-like HicB family nuclease
MSRKKPTIEFKIDIIVETDEGGFHAYCPALKGLHTAGESKEEALLNAKEAAIAYLESLIKHNDPIPIGVIKIKELEETPLSTTHNVSYYTEDLKVACAI